MYPGAGPHDPPAASTAAGKAVIFDLGGVVLDWRPLALLEHFYGDEDAPLRQRIRLEVFEHPDWLALDRGTLTHAAAIPRFAARSGRPEAEMARLLVAVRDSLRPIPQTVALMRALAAAGVPLYCLSNMHAEIAAWLLRTWDFWPLFGGIVFSAHERSIKPEPEIFRTLLARHGLEAPRTAFVDDHPANVAAARQLGLHAIAFRDAEQCAAELWPWLRAGVPGAQSATEV